MKKHVSKVNKGTVIENRKVCVRWALVHLARARACASVFRAHCNPAALTQGEIMTYALLANVLCWSEKFLMFQKFCFGFAKDGFFWNNKTYSNCCVFLRVFWWKHTLLCVKAIFYFISLTIVWLRAWIIYSALWKYSDPHPYQSAKIILHYNKKK